MNTPIPTPNGDEAPEFRLRSYQTEMLEHSLKRNVIVSMDTGSGKTHIALARARSELEICAPHKIVWFLAPTVTLCNQQYILFCDNLPAYPARLLTGAENIETWTEQRVWDKVLLNIRVVVSTPDVLLDAMGHGFLSMSKIAMLIFDEAHHCTKSHPTNKIMKNFYHRIAAKNAALAPPILGLTATPVINGSPKALRDIEQNLNAKVVIPQTNRTEFLRHVNRPVLAPLVYRSDVSGKTGLRNSAILSRLQHTLHNHNIDEDPYVIELMDRFHGANDSFALSQLEKVYKKNSTYCIDQIKTLYTRVHDIYEQLGGQAAEHYVRTCAARLRRLRSDSNQQLLDWSDNEKEYLCTLLEEVVGVPAPDEGFSDHLSVKASALINFLVKEHHEGFRGLIFAEQRAVVACLSRLLTERPETNSLFQVGAFVGASANFKRKGNISELTDLRDQDRALQDFRVGTRNLLVATSVLEEGIDVPDCHLVICFDPPTNLKMFVQRRGRARKQNSKYVIMLPQGSLDSDSSKWSALEDMLKEQYMDEMREVEKVRQSELLDEEDDSALYVPSTEALLTADNAISHLYHFCAILNTGPYADHRPEFSIKDAKGEITAEVTLPLAVDYSLRRASSARSWKTEKAARKDAAFQAYKALYDGGLINSNLLPLRAENKDLPKFNIVDNIPSMIDVSSRTDPWARLIQTPSMERHRYRISFNSSLGGQSHLDILTPSALPQIPYYTLFWNQSMTYTVSHQLLGTVALDTEQIGLLQQVTQHLQRSSMGKRIKDDKQDFLVLLLPTEDTKPLSLKSWLSDTKGFLPALRFESSEATGAEGGNIGLVHRKDALDERFILRSVEDRIEDGQLIQNDKILQVTKFPKRKDFLHPVLANMEQNAAYTTLQKLIASECEVDRIPARLQLAVNFVPAVLHRCEVYMVADELRQTVLAPAGTMDLELVLSAITATAAHEHVNYQRIEYLGDCLLKFCTSLRLMANNPTWPESYLTAEKGRTVSNGFLAKASLRAGLDKFIIRKNFTGAKWQPMYISDVLQRQYNQSSSTPTETLSSKTVADVVESLIGAAFLSTNTIASALLCMRTLLPTEPWLSLPESHAALLAAATPPSTSSPPQLDILESLLGHTFTLKPLLLEALTHPSFLAPLPTDRAASYQRLEFLGDAVLDYIVSTRLFAHAPPFPHHRMHTLRTALVNGYLLAFLAFEHTVAVARNDPKSVGCRSAPVLLESHSAKALHHFLRHSSPAIPPAQAAATTRHAALRGEIAAALETGREYPWVALEQLRAEKVFSDIVESVIGAVYIDSGGDVAACERYLERLGLLRVMRRVLGGEVDCLHPKERVGHLAGDERVKYVQIVKGKEEMKPSEDAGVLNGASAEEGNAEQVRGYVCRVKIGERWVGEEVQGALRSDTETLAAWRAVKILEAEIMEGRLET